MLGRIDYGGITPPSSGTEELDLNLREESVVVQVHETDAVDPAPVEPGVENRAERPVDNVEPAPVALPQLGKDIEQEINADKDPTVGVYRAPAQNVGAGVAQHVIDMNNESPHSDVDPTLDAKVEQELVQQEDSTFHVGENVKLVMEMGEGEGSEKQKGGAQDDSHLGAVGGTDVDVNSNAEYLMHDELSDGDDLHQEKVQPENDNQATEQELNNMTLMERYKTLDRRGRSRRTMSITKTTSN